MKQTKKQYIAKIDLFYYDIYDEVGNVVKTSRKAFIKGKAYSEVEEDYGREGYIGLLDEEGKTHAHKAIYFEIAQ